MAKNLNIRPETIKLEENIGNKLLDLSLNDVFFFLELTPKARATKAKQKTDKCDYICFWIAKKAINKMKR